jgi:signal transduction histidine kinase
MSSGPTSRAEALSGHAPDRVRGPRTWRSLGARLAVWYVLVTVGSFLVAAAAFALRMQASVQHEAQRSAETALERYRSALENGGTDALQSMFDCSPTPRPSLALRLTDERDIEIFAISSDEVSRRAAARSARDGRSAAVPEEWRFAQAEVSQSRRLSLALQDEPAARLWHELRETSWIIFGLGLALAILGALIITRRTLRPVTDLAKATQQIVESGDLSLRVPTRAATDELAQLTRLFNRMLAHNEALVRAMRESLDYVAHDLRTPLTRLRAGAELALRGPADTTAERDALAEIVEESDRVLSMLTTLTDITEAEAGAMRLDKRALDLGTIAREAVELYEFVAKEAGVSVVTHIGADAEILADRRRISQVATNLMDNAIKYTPAGGRVEVSVFTGPHWATLRVSDTGIGIAPEDQVRVWERLFRADRSRGERGLGLGLSLVKAVVEAHGGEVRLDSEVGVGSTFDVLLRRASEP